MPTIQSPPPDLTRPMYLIGFWQKHNGTDYKNSAGFYMLSGFRQPYYDYNKAVEAAAKIAASDDSVGKELFIFVVHVKITPKPVIPPVDVQPLPLSYNAR